MSSYGVNKWLCVDCKTHVKRGGQGSGRYMEVICPKCHNLMASMGTDFQMPKKNDKKAWKQLEKFKTNRIS